MNNRSDLWENEKSTIEQLIKKIWEIPELPLMEYKSSQILCEWLDAEEFMVKRNYCDLPTAFKASYGEGDNTIGIIAEYDALPGLDNDATHYRKKLGNAAGHGCMHSHIAGANIGAAVALKNYIKEKGIRGKIVVIGCPAEEIIYGKIALLERGGFDNIDILLTSHVDFQNGSLARPSEPVIYSEFLFEGFSNHLGAFHKKNALDAAELCVQTIERLRSHNFSNLVPEHVLRNSGHIPNIVPDEVRLWLRIRSLDLDYKKLKEGYKEILNIAKHCADLTHTTMKEEYISSTNGYLPNEVLGRTLYRTIEALGPPAYHVDELNEIKEFCSKANNDSTFTFDQGIQYYNQGYDSYAQDDGEVSWHIPLGRINWAVPEQIPLHNWIMTAYAGLPISNIGALWASKVLYLTCQEIFENPLIITEAKEELINRCKNKEIDKPKVGNFDLCQNSRNFWSVGKLL